jgi:glycerate-2-kinase
MDREDAAGLSERGAAISIEGEDAAGPATARHLFVDYDRLVSHGRCVLRGHALTIAAAALGAVDPAAAFRRLVRLEGSELCVVDPGTGAQSVFDLANRRVFLVGAGKASIGVAIVLDELLGERISDGAVVVKHGQAPRRQPLHLEVIEAAHPVPDEESLRGGLRLLDIAEKANDGDFLIALVSGGSSSLAVAPAEGISLEDKIATNRVLLASGADIVSMNSVRKHLSRIKGGLLAHKAGCQILNLTVSDVVGDPLDCITDLTVPDSSTFQMAQAACDHFELWGRLPTSVEERLRRADPDQETPKPDVFRQSQIVTVVLANAALMCEAAVREAARLGYRAEVVSLAIEGEAAGAGQDLAERLITAVPATALVLSGENTVTLGGQGLGDGLGGPSQEAALGAAVNLPAGQAACILCIDSDGTDGPTEAAGGLVDDLTMQTVFERGVDVERALAEHTCYPALAAIGDIVVTGSTGTNVNDLKIALKGNEARTRFESVHAVRQDE